MKNLVKEFLKKKFYQDKNAVIANHILVTDNGGNLYQFKSGTHWCVILNSTAYSRNGYFYSVILKDDKYIEELEKTQKDDIIEFLDNELAAKYEEEKVLDIELEE